MAYYAHVVGGVVQNVIVADTWDIADEVASTGVQAVDVTGQPVGIGWTYDAETEEFTAPPEPEPEPTP